MPPQRETLGTLMPVGGGDPIPLLKPELVVGRRAELRHPARFRERLGQALRPRFINGVWHVRDLGSTNGTTVNGSR